MTLSECLTVLGLLTISGCNLLWGNSYYRDPEQGACSDASVPGCQRNADCPSGLCVDVQLGTYAPGSCVPTDKLSYVDADHCTVGAEDGTSGKRFCGVQKAVDSIGPQDQALHIFLVKPARQAYPGIKVTRGNLALIGPWADPRLKGTPWDQESTSAVLAGSADPEHSMGLSLRGEPSHVVELVVDGIRIIGVDTGLAVNVENYGFGANLTLRRTIVSGSAGNGINISNGPTTFTMDRCKVAENQKVGLFLSAQTGMFSITNSLFVSNGILTASNGVTLDGVTEGIFDHNTVTGNGPAGAGNFSGGINCMRSQRISNSIVSGNSYASGTQFLGGSSSTNPSCRLYSTVVGDQNENISEGTKCNPALDKFSRLTAGLTACAIDHATDNPDRNLDFFGTRRPQGKASDIGFHELVTGSPPACAP